MTHADVLVLDDTIQLTRRIGLGSTGEVWEAHQSGAERIVAVKLRHRHATSGDWQHEARMLARVEHPHIVAVLMHGRLDGRQALVLERVDGPDLRQMLDALRDGAGAPTAAAAATALGVGSPSGAWVDPYWRTATTIVRDVARALDHAHRCGVVHRDVKPANILVDRSGCARLTDFGLAAVGTMSDDDGSAAGTLAYIAPERLEGAHATPASDIYSLGVVLEELVTLEVPLLATTLPGAIAEITGERGARRALLGGGRDLRAILDRACALRPSERYVTAGDLARDLQALLDDRPVLARPEGLFLRTSRFVRRRRSAMVSFLGLSVATTVVASAVATQVVRSAEREARAATLSGAALDEAMSSWDDVIIDSAVSLAADKPMLERARAGVLQRALQMGHDLLATTSVDERAAGRFRAVEARTLVALANSMRRLGRWKRSRDLIEDARCAAPFVSADVRSDVLARCAMLELSIAAEIGSIDDRILTAEAARLLLYDEDRPLPAFDYMKPSVWTVLAGASSRRGDRQSALEYADRAIEAVQDVEWGSSSRSEALRRIEFARSLGVRSAALVDLGRSLEGGEEARRAIECLRGLMEEQSAQKICGTAWNNVGSMLRSEGRWSEALDAERKALELQEAVVASSPDATVPRFDYARTLYRVAFCLDRSSDESEEVERAFARALDELDRVLDSVDDWIQATQIRAATHFRLAICAQEARRHAAAARSYAAAMDDYERAQGQSPTDVSRGKVRECARRHVACFLVAHRPAAGIERVRAVADRFAEDEVTLYDLACMTAVASTKTDGDWLERSGEATSLAIDLLLEAFSAGHRRTEYIETSEVFAGVRAHVRFGEVRAAAARSGSALRD
ncbi:MAG: serine/threonine-protein kinase [Planctomycetota bacterium]